MKTIIDAVNNESLVHQAYERVKGDLMALKPEELVQVNLDIPSAVTTILGMLPEVQELRPRIEKELPAFDLNAFDKLEDYALALSYAQTKYLTATQPPDDLPELVDEATKLRERMLAEARSLSVHGLVDNGQLARLKGANGYKNLAQDLQILSEVMQEAWPKARGRLMTTAEDLERAYRLSARLMRVVGLREQGPAQLAHATDTRLRAFTIVIRVYEETRRAVAYLRAREGDVDSIIPSLYATRGRKKQSESPSPSEQEQPVTRAIGASAGETLPGVGTVVPAVAPSSAGPAPAPAAVATNGAVAGTTDPFLS